MRIAYLAPYQGSTLLTRRPVVRNRSLSNKVKIELVATILRARSHDVEVISQGEVVDTAWTFYPSLVEEEPFHPDIPIYYGSVLPVRRLNGLWSSARTLQLLKQRHRHKPFDVVIAFNMKGPQITCSDYAIRHLGLPVILEYEDDRFVDVRGEALGGDFWSRLDIRAPRRLLRQVAGCLAVSPHLLSQLPPGIPTLLLRGVVGYDLIEAARRAPDGKRNRILFSGTHIASNGVAQLIEAWRDGPIPDWELHITGYGQLTDSLKNMARGVPGVIFHGLVSRAELVALMCSAKLCINPHSLSRTPGNVFAFKLIEYLAAGAHVITTPMGALEPHLEAGITYMPDNSPPTISLTLRQVIAQRRYEQTSAQDAQRAYGPAAVSDSLESLLGEVVLRRTPPPGLPVVASAGRPS